MTDLLDFATRYTAAWCSQDAASVASFFTSDGSLKVNDSPAAVGRAAITATARGFMDTFPDLEVRMDRLEGRHYHWTLTGTNSEGRKVCVSGFEAWTFGPDGLINASLGHFDADEYQKQMGGGN